MAAELGRSPIRRADRGLWIAEVSQLPVGIDAVAVTIAEYEAEGVAADEASISDRRSVGKLNGRRSRRPMLPALGARASSPQARAGDRRRYAVVPLDGDRFAPTVIRSGWYCIASTVIVPYRPPHVSPRTPYPTRQPRLPRPAVGSTNPGLARPAPGRDAHGYSPPPGGVRRLPRGHLRDQGDAGAARPTRIQDTQEAREADHDAQPAPPGL